MEVVVIALLVSTLTTTGLAALAAATARGHWFLRTTAFLAVIAPLLAIPAYEPFVALALQGATIAAGVHLARRRARRRLASERAGSSPTPARATADAPPSQLSRSAPRFRIATLLWATVLLGIAAAIAARMPAIGWRGWLSLGAVGVGGGLAVLSGWYMATRRRSLKFVALPFACIVALLIALAVMSVDWFIHMLNGGDWPPPSDGVATPLLGISLLAEESTGILWMPAMIAIVGVPSVIVWLFAAAIDGERTSWARRLAGTVAVVGVMILAIPAVNVLWRMLTPLPIPQVVLPEPNAYDEFVVAGEMTLGTLPNSGNYDETTATRNEVAKAASQVLPAVLRLRLAFDRESHVPMNYLSPDSLNLSEIQQLRSLGRGLSSIGKLAELDSDIDGALTAYLDTFRLGAISPRGGMLINGLVGSAIKNIGVARVFRLRERLSPEQCNRAIAVIRDTMRQEETYEALEHRDLVWTQHAMGWHGRLHRILSELAGDAVPGQYRTSFDQNQAAVELLLGHLALRAYHAEYGAWPENWSQVEAAGLPPLATDPMDPAGRPLRYRRIGDEYLLYSLAVNGIDDGGVAPAEGLPIDPAAKEDLLLERAFAE